MTRELRIAKLKMLLGKTNFIVHHPDHDGVEAHYSVRWSAPRERQVAIINAKTGHIIRWHILNGDVVDEFSSKDGSCLNVAKVDRRINWLMHSNQLRVAS